MSVTTDLLPVEAALEAMIETLHLSAVKGEALPSATVNLLEARGRILASDIVAPVQVPPFDNSAVDGYAIRSGDLGSGKVLQVVGRVTAGVSWSGPSLVSGAAIRIFTGAPVPEGADAVIMQEDVDVSEPETASDRSHISLTRLDFEATHSGSNIRRAGQDIVAGSTLLRTGQLLEPRHVGLLASIGLNDVPVFSRITVALLSSGDELVEPGRPLKPGQIYNSNRYLLSSWLEQMGCDVFDVGIVGDTLESCRDALQRAASNSQLVISTGGMSVGEEDHIRAAAETIGSIGFWRIRMKPGKPLAFGTLGQTALLGIPGNPGAAFVTSLIFGTPLIRWLQGKASHIKDPKTRLAALLPRPERLPAAFSRDMPAGRREFLRSRIVEGRIEPFDNQSSGMLTSACWADGLAVVPEHETVAEGALLDFYRLSSFGH